MPMVPATWRALTPTWIIWLPSAYDAAVVEGMEPVLSSFGETEPGILQPLEAVIWK